MVANDESFPAQARLKRRADFKRVSSEGQRASGPHLIVVGRKNGLDTARLGITVTRKVGNATQRNRWKRRLREAFRRNKPRVCRGWDFVVIVKNTVSSEPAFEQLSEELLTLMSQTCTRR